MEKWLVQAVRGTSVPPEQEGLPPWLDKVLDIKKVMMEYRIRLMEDAVPHISPGQEWKRHSIFPAANLVLPLYDIIDHSNWKIMKEIFILLHRKGWSFPAILIPDLLDAPARDRKYIENIIYLAPRWTAAWLEGHQEDQAFSPKVLERWKRLLLMPKTSDENLNPRQLLFLIRHDIFNESFPSEELLNRTWDRLNTEKRSILIDLLPNDDATESFLWPRLRTRSATLKHHITLKLMKVKGAFYEVIQQLAQSIPEQALTRTDAWPENVKEGLRTSLHMEDDEDIEGMIFRLQWKDLLDTTNLPPEEVWSGLSDHLRASLVSGALLGENIRPLIALMEKNRKSLIDISAREIKMLSSAAYNHLLELVLNARWMNSRDKVELTLLKESYFPAPLSIKLVKWLRYDIIDKKPFLAEEIIEALSYRADPRIYPELVAMNEQSIYYTAEVVKPLKLCIQTMQQRMAFRSELQKLKDVR